jgi:4-amino-4-deoxy-L-arabinose transferase-like glycosyltransferase
MSEAGSNESDVDRRNKTPRALFGMLLGIVAVCLFVRLRLADAPLERDEGEFGYTAQLILSGESPSLAYNYKLPGVAYAYAASFLLFDDTARSIRWALLTVNAGACLFLFLLARRLYGGAVASVAVGCYALASLDVSVLGHAAHATQFANAFGLAGLWTANPANPPRLRRFLTAGVLFGCALLMKQHAAFFLLLALFQTLFASADGAGWRTRVRTGALLCAGFVLPYLAVVAVVAAQGAWSTFWTWTVTYAVAATSTINLQGGWLGLKESLGALGKAFGWLWLAGGLGVVLAVLHKRGRWERGFPLLYALLATPAVAAGLYFRGHYFLLLLPAACLGAGIAWEALRRALERVGAPRPTSIACALLCFGFCASLYAHREYFFVLSPERFSRELYGNNPFVESPALGAMMREWLAPDERFAVLGSEAQLYFYARRRSATGFIYMYGLTDKGRRAKEMQERFLAELTDSAPRILVFVGSPSSWGFGDREMGAFFSRLDAFLRNKYRLIGRLEIEPERTRAIWGEALKTEPTGSGAPLLLYERRS